MAVATVIEDQRKTEETALITGKKPSQSLASWRTST